MKSPRLEFITIGQILAPRDIKGKLKISPQCLAPCSQIYINRHPMTIASTGWRKLMDYQA